MKQVSRNEHTLQPSRRRDAAKAVPEIPAGAVGTII